MGLLAFTSHEGQLKHELKEKIKNSTYVCKAYQTIGYEIDSVLSESDDDNDVPRDFGLPQRPRALRVWAQFSGGYDAQWLIEPNHGYICDDGTFFKQREKVVLTPIEQLSSYGLYFLESEINSLGEFDFTGLTNPNGWSESDLIYHHAECIMAAYQCLNEITRIEAGLISNDKVREADIRHKSHDYVKAGKKGAEIRLKKKTELLKLTYKLAAESKQPSIASMSREITPKVLSKAREIGYNSLKDDSAEKSIYRWLLDWRKTK